MFDISFAVNILKNGFPFGQQRLRSRKIPGVTDVIYCRCRQNVERDAADALEKESDAFQQIDILPDDCAFRREDIIRHADIGRGVVFGVAVVSFRVRRTVREESVQRRDESRIADGAVGIDYAVSVVSEAGADHKLPDKIADIMPYGRLDGEVIGV